MPRLGDADLRNGERIAFAYREALSREPDDAERRVLEPGAAQLIEIQVGTEHRGGFGARLTAVQMRRSPPNGHLGSQEGRENAGFVSDSR